MIKSGLMTIFFMFTVFVVVVVNNNEENEIDFDKEYAIANDCL